MSRGLRLLVLGFILLASVAFAAALIWLEKVLDVSLVLGLLFLVLGTASTILHLSLSDDFLRRRFGEPSASQMRRFWRRSWVGVVLGAAMVGIHLLDHWVRAAVVESQFQVAYNRGISAAKERDWKTASDAFSEAIRNDPKNVLSYRQRGVAYLQQGELDLAIADFDEALRLAPDDAMTLYNRGLVYVHKNELDRALGEFGEAIRLKPDYAKAYLTRSRVHGMKGDDARAQEDHKKAVELDPALDKPSGPRL